MRVAHCTRACFATCGKAISARVPGYVPCAIGGYCWRRKNEKRIFPSPSKPNFHFAELHQEMKRFVWRLQRVLDVKTKQEQVKRIELFRLTEELAGKRSELLMRRRILQDVIRDVAKTGSPTRVSAQEFCLRHAATNDEQIRRLRGEIAELEARQKEKTVELLAIRRAREGLERLRAEARERFLRECDRLEQKDLDDKTTSAFARREPAENRCET